MCTGSQLLSVSGFNLCQCCSNADIQNAIRQHSFYLICHDVWQVIGRIILQPKQCYVKSQKMQDCVWKFLSDASWRHIETLKHLISELPGQTVTRISHQFTAARDDEVATTALKDVQGSCEIITANIPTLSFLPFTTCTSGQFTMFILYSTPQKILTVFIQKKEQKICPKRQKGKVRFIILAFKKWKVTSICLQGSNEKVLRET